jgi:outer membrane protein
MSNQWMQDKKLSAIFLALLIFATQGVADEADKSAPNAPELTQVEDFIALGLQQNQQLQARDFSSASAQQSLRAARAAFWPTLTLDARYSRSEGGRTISFPIGDALNPVYQSLNRLTATSANPTQFPSIENNEFELLRGREQDTRLKISAPIYSPLLDAALEAAAAQADDATASREIFARTLVRDIRRAYNGYGQATAATGVLLASQALLQENLRINAALVAAGSATRDRELRARAELLAVQDRLQSSENSVAGAKRYLNFLVNRDLNAALPEPQVSLSSAPQGRVLARPELAKLDANLALARAALSQASAARKPSIGFGLDAGIQGENYGFGSGQNFSAAAIVLNWRLFDFGQTRAQQAAANARIEAISAERKALSDQLSLAAAQAQDDLASAIKRLETAQARKLAAEEGFRIIARKRDAGAATQVEFLDAERARTEAELALHAARFDQANQLAELELALAAYPLPLQLGLISTRTLP